MTPALAVSAASRAACLCGVMPREFGDIANAVLKNHDAGASPWSAPCSTHC